MKWTPRLTAVLVAGAAAVAATVTPANAALTLSSTPAASWRVNGTVYAEVIVGDTLVVGGDFNIATPPSGQAATRVDLAAFSMTTGALLSGWRADTNDTVRALATDGTSIWVGGSFTTVAGQTHRRVAEISGTTGAPYAAFTGTTNGTVRALDVDGPDLYVGGLFSTAGNVTKSRLARLSATTGALNTTFTGSTNGAVYALLRKPNSNVLYVAGDFNTLSGTGRVGLGAVNANTGAITGSSFVGTLRPTLGLSTNTTGTLLYAGQGGSGNRAIAWSTTNYNQLWHVTTAGDVQAVLYYAGVTYMGFHDGWGGSTQYKVLGIDPTTGAVSSWRPLFDEFLGVESLAASTAGVAVGGQFSNVSGVAAQGFARFPAQP